MYLVSLQGTKTFILGIDYSQKKNKIKIPVWKVKTQNILL